MSGRRTAHGRKVDALKRALRRLLYPGAAAVPLCAGGAAALLVYVFTAGEKDGPLAYASYLFSAYALAPSVRTPWRLFDAAAKGWRAYRSCSAIWTSRSSV